MADLTERTYINTLRVEMDRYGDITNRQTHECVEIIRNADTDKEVIESSKTRRVELDAAAFSEALGKLYADALTQIDAMEMELTATKNVVKEKDFTITYTMGQLNDKDAQISSKNAQIATKDSEIVRLNTLIM